MRSSCAALTAARFGPEPVRMLIPAMCRACVCALPSPGTCFRPPGTLVSACSVPMTWPSVAATALIAAPAGVQGPESIKLDGRASIVLGRSGDADVKLEGKLCSRKHATIAYDPAKGDTYVLDLGSAHGTFVNQVRVDQTSRTRLKLGQQVWFGNATGEPRYTVHALAGGGKKRAREEEIKSKQIDGLIRTSAMAMGDGKRSRPFWSENGQGSDANGSQNQHAAKVLPHVPLEGHTNSSTDALAAAKADSTCCHVLLRHQTSTLPNAEQTASVARRRLAGYLRDVERCEITFEQLALRVSECCKTKALQGYVKEKLRRKWEDQHPSFHDALLALKGPGDVSGIVETAMGLHLIKRVR